MVPAAWLAVTLPLGESRALTAATISCQASPANSAVTVLTTSRIVVVHHSELFASSPGSRYSMIATRHGSTSDCGNALRRSSMILPAFAKKPSG